MFPISFLVGVNQAQVEMLTVPSPVSFVFPLKGVGYTLGELPPVSSETVPEAVRPTLDAPYHVPHTSEFVTWHIEGLSQGLQYQDPICSSLEGTEPSTQATPSMFAALRSNLGPGTQSAAD